MKNKFLREIALHRLEELGCKELPPNVATAVIEGYVNRAEGALKRLAKRGITIPQIAKIFSTSFDKEKESRGENEGCSSGEMGAVNDASSIMRQNP